jgi:predicted lipid-binding transport protein (Tim44 family)
VKTEGTQGTIPAPQEIVTVTPRPAATVSSRHGAHRGVGGVKGGLMFGLIGGLSFGGLFCLRHFILRLVLWMNRLAPLNYVHFLDYAAARLFLRKVGGGYIFSHRMLMDYFTSLHRTKQA